MDNNRLKNYIVQVEGSRLKGSGVLFKYFNDVYIFTAKHNLEYTEDQKIKKIDINKLQKEKNDIKIYPYENLQIEDIIELDKDLDILILKIDKSSIDIIEINSLSIFDKILNNSLSCTIVGYPKIRNDKSIEFFDCTYEVSDKSTFEVHSDKVNALSEKQKKKELVGLSGGGAFVESNGQIYLLGIQIRYEGFSNLECINLQILLEQINKKLIKSNIETVEEKIKLNNGKILKLEFVKVELEDNKTLYVGKYPVTFEEYDLFCKEVGKVFTFLKGYENKPVGNVNWNDSNQYCKWLSKKIDQKCTLINSKDWEILESYISKEKNINEWCKDGVGNEKKIKTDFGTELVRSDLKKLKISFRYNILS